MFKNEEHRGYAERFPRDARVRLVRTTDAFTRLRPGTEGTVVSVRWADEPRIGVRWDDGSSLTMLPYEGDEIERVDA